MLADCAALALHSACCFSFTYLEEGSRGRLMMMENTRKAISTTSSGAKPAFRPPLQIRAPGVIPSLSVHGVLGGAGGLPSEPGQKRHRSVCARNHPPLSTDWSRGRELQECSCFLAAVITRTVLASLSRMFPSSTADRRHCYDQRGPLGSDQSNQPNPLRGEDTNST